MWWAAAAAAAAAFAARSRVLVLVLVLPNGIVVSVPAEQQSPLMCMRVHTKNTYCYPTCVLINQLTLEGLLDYQSTPVRTRHVHNTLAWMVHEN